MTMRITALALLLVLALSLLFIRARRPREIVAFHDISRLTQEFEGERLPGALLRYRLTPAQVTERYPGIGVNRQYDPDAHFVNRRNHERRSRWTEHPDGSFVRRTNRQSMRRDADVGQAKSGYRIVLTGDSHLDGVLDNSENACALVEAELSRTHGEGSVEVLNMAAGGYGFYHYLGTLERALRLGLEPDVLCVVVYGGNDFGDVSLWHAFEGTPLPPGTSPERRETRSALIARNASHFGQCVNDIEFCRTQPDEVPVMRRMAREVTAELARVCAEHGIELVVAYLPSPLQVPDRADVEPLREMLAELGLHDEDVGVLDGHAADYLRFLDESGIERIDLRESFRDETGRLYWAADGHLNLAGHAATARALAPVLARLVSR